MSSLLPKFLTTFDQNIESMGSVKIIKASAGSGKTYRLAYEYIKGVVLEPHLYRATLAVTFTNKATEQMKRRIIEGLDALARGSSPYMDELLEDTALERAVIVRNAADARTLILHDYSRFAVSTIDKFFQRVTRAFFKELGLDFDYTVEIDRQRILGTAIDRLLESTASDRALAGSVERIVDERADRGLGWDVKPQIARLGDELFKESYRPNPNSVEHIVTTYDAIRSSVEERVKALKIIAGRAVDLMTAAGLEPADFKGGSKSFVHYFHRLLGSDTPLMYSNTFAQSADNDQAWYTKTAPSKERIMQIIPSLTPLVREIVERVDELWADKNSLALVGENLSRSLLLTYLNDQLQVVAAERGIVMIHQTAALIHRLVSGNDAPFIYEKVGNAYARYMIDEFQDTSQQQWHNFLPLLENSIAQSEQHHDSVMLIGDVKQSIYRWRGGNWRILGFEAEDHFREVLASPVAMDTNWRSERNIIEFNNRLIRRVVELDTAALVGLLEPKPELLPLAAMLGHSYESFEQKASPRKMESATPQGYVQVTVADKDDVPAQLLETVADIVARGYALRDIAVLVRSAHQARAVADALLGGGYAIVSQEALLLCSSPVVEFVMATFRLAQYPDDPISRAQWNHFRGFRYSRAVDSAEGMFLNSLLRSTPGDAFEMVVRRYELGALTGDLSFLQALYQVVISYSKQGISDIQMLLDWWDENGRKKTIYLPSEQDAITIQTIHKAKGLEFTCVIIPYCDWELLPKSTGTQVTTLWADTDREPFAEFGPMPVNYKKDMAQSCYSDLYYRESVYSHVDNINLLYVALTRAERELYIMYDRAARGEQRVSKLIDAVLADIPDLDSVGDDLYSYGTKGGPSTVAGGGADRGAERQIVIENFPCYDAGSQLRVRWSSDRYFGADADVVSPRRHGIVMHKLFGLIDSVADIDTALESMIRAGDIAPEDRVGIRDMAVAVLDNPTVQSWFSPGWDVRSEQDIISTTGVRRPDRVMIRDGIAVVVDYKFGAMRNPKYRRQVQEYMSLLGAMGYSDVTGYVWYVELGDVEQVV